MFALNYKQIFWMHGGFWLQLFNRFGQITWWLMYVFKQLIVIKPWTNHRSWLYIYPASAVFVATQGAINTIHMVSFPTQKWCKWNWCMPQTIEVYRFYLLQDGVMMYGLHPYISIHWAMIQTMTLPASQPWALSRYNSRSTSYDRRDSRWTLIGFVGFGSGNLSGNLTFCVRPWIFLVST